MECTLSSYLLLRTTPTCDTSSETAQHVLNPWKYGDLFVDLSQFELLAGEGQPELSTTLEVLGSH